MSFRRVCSCLYMSQHAGHSQIKLVLGDLCLHPSSLINLKQLQTILPIRHFASSDFTLTSIFPTTIPTVSLTRALTKGINLSLTKYFPVDNFFAKKTHNSALARMLFCNFLRRYLRQRQLRRRSRSAHISHSVPPASSVGPSVESPPQRVYDGMFEAREAYVRMFSMASNAEAEFRYSSEWPLHLNTDMEEDPLTMSGIYPSDIVSAQVATFLTPESHRLSRCPICLEALGENLVTTGNCLHLIHTTCLLSWFQHDPTGTCPVCRHSLSPTSSASSTTVFPQDIMSTLRAQSFSSSIEPLERQDSIDIAVTYGHLYIPRSHDMLSTTMEDMNEDDELCSLYRNCRNGRERLCTSSDCCGDYMVQWARDEDCGDEENEFAFTSEGEGRRQVHHHEHHHMHVHGNGTSEDMGRVSIDRSEVDELSELIRAEEREVDYRDYREQARSRYWTLGLADVDNADVAPWDATISYGCGDDEESGVLSGHGRVTSSSMTVQQWLQTVNGRFDDIVPLNNRNSTSSLSVRGYVEAM